MKTKQLPKYFIVKRDLSNPLWNKYISWLNETYSTNWAGDRNEYYGFDGDFVGGNRGTKAAFNINTFINNPVLLTLEEWDNIINSHKIYKYVIKDTAFLKPANLLVYNYIYNSPTITSGFLTTQEIEKLTKAQVLDLWFDKEIVVDFVIGNYYVYKHKNHTQLDKLVGFHPNGTLSFKGRENEECSPNDYRPATEQEIKTAQTVSITLSNNKIVEIKAREIIAGGEKVNYNTLKELSNIGNIMPKLNSWNVSLTSATFKIGCWEDVKLSDIQAILKAYENVNALKESLVE